VSYTLRVNMSVVDEDGLAVDLNGNVASSAMAMIFTSVDFKPYVLPAQANTAMHVLKNTIETLRNLK